MGERRLGSSRARRARVGAIVFARVGIDRFQLTRVGNENIVTERTEKMTDPTGLCSDLHGRPAGREAGELSLEGGFTCGQTGFFDHFSILVEDHNVGELISQVQSDKNSAILIHRSVSFFGSYESRLRVFGEPNHVREAPAFSSQSRWIGPGMLRQKQEKTESGTLQKLVSERGAAAQLAAVSQRNALCKPKRQPKKFILEPKNNPSFFYQHPAELLRRLIQFDTTNPPGNEAACIAFINGLLTDAGVETTILGKTPDRPNLMARLPGQGSAAPLLLYGHVDVVTTENQQWQQPPFEGKVTDGFVWGRGALDMKGGVAMMLAAFLRAKSEHLKLHGDVILAIVSDEEAGGVYGTKYLVENHADLFDGIRYAIGEFGGFTFYVGKRRFYPVMIAEKQIC